MLWFGRINSPLDMAKPASAGSTLGGRESAEADLALGCGEFIRRMLPFVAKLNYALFVPVCSSQAKVLY